jgi:glycine/D-amino acid oxidase-like deaminating enzyme
MRLRVGSPVWLSHEPQRLRRTYKQLRGRHNADVVIVGGGITGAGIAQAFAEARVNVALVESAFIGHGSTAASTALLMQETDQELTALQRRYGRMRATRIWELSRGAVRDFVATLRRLRIACDLEEREAVYYTVNREDVDDLHAEYRCRRQAGFAATWLDRAALLDATGILAAGAIRSHGDAQLDPYRACLGLLRAAASDGARIFERSEVRRVDASRSGVIVRTRGGAITAKYVVVATGYATPVFAPLAGRFQMKHTYVLATRPVSRHDRSRLGLPDLLLWDTERPYHYARWTRGHRLLLGGQDRPMLPPARRKQAFASNTTRLREYFEALLPALEDIETESAWEGLFATTPDGLPYIGAHRQYPRHLFALGYGGNGMTFGFLAARLLLDAVEGMGNSDLQLFAFNRLRDKRSKEI